MDASALALLSCRTQYEHSCSLPVSWWSASRRWAVEGQSCLAPHLLLLGVLVDVDEHVRVTFSPVANRLLLHADDATVTRWRTLTKTVTKTVTKTYTSYRTRTRQSAGPQP